MQKIKDFFGRVDKFHPRLQAEVCLLCLLPGFPAAPHYFIHTPVVPCPSQNRACAIHAHGSSHVHSPSREQVDTYPWLWKGKPLLHKCELFPVHFLFASLSIQPLEQYSFYLIAVADYALRIVRYPIVLVVPSHFLLGVLPYLLIVHLRSVLFQPLCVFCHLRKEFLARSNTLHPKPLSVARASAIVREAQKVKCLRLRLPCSFTAFRFLRTKSKHLRLRGFYF